MKKKLSFEKYFLMGFFAILGVLSAILAGTYQVEYEKNIQKNEWNHEVDASVNGVEKNIIRANETIKLFQIYLDENQKNSIAVVSDEQLLDAYNAIDPISSFPGFKNVFISRPNGQVMASVPLPVKNVLNQKMPHTAINFSETMKERIPRWSYFSEDMMILSLPLKSGYWVSIGFAPYVFLNKSLAQDRTQTFSLNVIDQQSNKSLYKIINASQKGSLSSVRAIQLGSTAWKMNFIQSQPYTTSIWPIITVFLISFLAFLLCMVILKMMQIRDQAEEKAIDFAKKFTNADAKFKHVNEEMPGVVLLLDENKNIIEINKEGRLRLSNSQGVVDLGQMLQSSDFLKAIETLNQEGRSHIPKVRVQTKEGDVWMNISLSRVLIDSHPHTLVLGNDIGEMVKLSQQLEAQGQKLHYLASHDPLTGLYNRRAFEEKIDEWVFSSKTFSTIYIDLDQFKIINDTAGHLAGDRLLVGLSEKLRAASPEIFFARLGGDEFGVIVGGVQENAVEVSKRILKIAEDFVFSWENKAYPVTVSLGIADSQTVRSAIMERPINKEDIMSRADAACYMSKQMGRNRLHIFSLDGESSLHHQEMEWTIKIQEAISQGRLLLYRQKIVPLMDDEKSSKYEILVRLLDSSGNKISAGDFIPAAERFGLMSSFDRWVFGHAFENFHILAPNGETYSINVSGQTVDDPSFEDFLVDLIIKNGVPPEQVCIEITETAAIKNINRMENILPRVRLLGCKVALDDFGVGMSSFSYLKKFKADYIKIDGNFIRDIEQNTTSQSIVSAIAEMSKQMGIDVVAECVGSENVVELLKEKGVKYGQGFFLAIPEPIPGLT